MHVFRKSLLCVERPVLPPPALLAAVVACLLAVEALADSTAQRVDERHRLNFYVVTPGGPEDGGDFGPGTPDTKTSGIQEALDRCKRDKKDLYLCGGAVPEPFKPGVAYFLHETLRIPWMQDFKLDGGECVLQYTRPSGDAIVIDSQMSCRYKFGLVALPRGKADGAAIRVQPRSRGPDGLCGVTCSVFEINAVVGAGTLGLEKEKFQGIGTGLALDATHGPIVHNKFRLIEALGCETAVYLASPSPSQACLNNWITCTFAHISNTHFRLGDPGGCGVLFNRVEALIDSQGIEGSIGVQVFGTGNRLDLTFLQVGEKQGVVFESEARDNVVTAVNLAGRYTNRARFANNKINVDDAAGLAVETPPFPASEETIENRYPCSVAITVTQRGKIEHWSVTHLDGSRQQIEGGLYPGQLIVLAPGARVSFRHAAPALWHWRCME